MITSTSTAANAAKVLIAFATAQVPTVSHWQNPVGERFTPESSIALGPQEESFKSKTVVPISEKRAEIAARPTTQRELVVGELRLWNLLAADWDGEGAAAPSTASIKDAVSFVRLLEDADGVPEPMLLASGNAGLYWNDNALYADIEFLGNGRIAYFVKKNADKHKGVVAEFNPKEMPSVFPVLLRVERTGTENISYRS